MELVYELTSGGSHRPVLVAPLGEYMQSRWLKAAEHHAPSVAGIIAKDSAAIASAQQTGHAAPQHTGYAMAVFSQRKMAPVELPDSVPGVHIALDEEAKRVRIFDPLEHLPNRQDIEAAFLAVYHKHRVPRPEVIYDRLSGDELSTWRAWLDKAEGQGVIERVQEEESAAEVPNAPQEQQPESEPEQQPIEQGAEQPELPVAGQETSSPAEPASPSDPGIATKRRPTGRRR